MTDAKSAQASPGAGGDSDAGAPGGLAVLSGDLGGQGLQAILAALVAWGLTVAPEAFAAGAPLVHTALAVACAVAGVLGPLLLRAKKPIGQHVGITAFLALAIATWSLSGFGLAPDRVDPMRAMLGAFAWGFYALSWRSPWRSGEAVDEKGAAPLEVRSRLPPLALPIAAIGAVGAAALLVLSFRVRGLERALLAHTLAVVAGVALVTAAASIAVGRGRPRERARARRVGPHAGRALLLLVALALVGLVVGWYR